jgi:hypothetical protein
MSAISRVWYVVDRAHAEEEHPGDDPVRHHAEDGGLDPDLGERGDPQHHEAHVTHRGERDQPFEVLLRQAREGRVDDRDGRQEPDPRRVLLRAVGQHRERDPDEPVGPHLQHDPGQ